MFDESEPISRTVIALRAIGRVARFFAIYIGIPLLLLVWWADRSLGPHLADIRAEDVASIEIYHYDVEPSPPVEGTCVCNDPKIIAEFLSLVRTGEPGKSHLCAPPVTITFNFKNGSKHKIHALPGHHEGYYEFWGRGIYRVNREAAIRMLQQMGMKKVPLRC